MHCQEKAVCAVPKKQEKVDVVDVAATVEIAVPGLQEQLGATVYAFVPVDPKLTTHEVPLVIVALPAWSLPDTKEKPVHVLAVGAGLEKS